MEELQKEVNEYRRREQQKTSEEPQDDSVGESKGNTININPGGEKAVFSTECVMTPGAEIKSLPSVSPITPPPNNTSPGNLSSNNSIESTTSPIGVEKERLGSKHSDGYTMDIDTHKDAPSLMPGSASTEQSTRNTTIQPQHQRIHMPQQFPFTTFNLTTPALPPTYNLATDWGWTNTPNLYRDSINHTAISGMESQEIVFFFSTYNPGQ
jgi:hypothetical protein